MPTHKVVNGLKSILPITRTIMKDYYCTIGRITKTNLLDALCLTLMKFHHLYVNLIL